MQTGFILLHSQKKDIPFNISLHPWEGWATCLRQIFFAHSSELPSAWRDTVPAGGLIYQDEEAYEFLLEVLCGLHSPLVAETEVFGQFKQFMLETIKKRRGDWPLIPLMNRMIKDVKSIRQNFLSGLGGQSYGSLTRKQLEPFSRVAFLGAGRLVKDILPWLAKRENLDVQVFCRSVERYRELRQEFPFIQLKDSIQQDFLATEALVVAASVESQWLEAWVTNRCSSPLRLVLDLRGEGEKDPLRLPEMNIVNLKEFFSTIEDNRRQTELVVKEVKLKIKQMTQQLREAVRHRPFGWDDLCA